jgi:hypothetical protein
MKCATSLTCHWHIIVPHHVLNDLSSLSFMNRVLIINLIIYLKISSSEFTIIMKYKIKIIVCSHFFVKLSFTMKKEVFYNWFTTQFWVAMTTCNTLYNFYVVSVFKQVAWIAKVVIHCIYNVIQL